MRVWLAMGVVRDPDGELVDCANVFVELAAIVSDGRGSALSTDTAAGGEFVVVHKIKNDCAYGVYVCGRAQHERGAWLSQ